eukprot:363391-Chlamydomonas_euryale.AAC.6
MRFQSQSQSYRERTHKGYACVEHSMAEGIKQRAGHCQKGHAIADGPEPPHTNPTRPTAVRYMHGYMVQVWHTWLQQFLLQYLFFSDAAESARHPNVDATRGSEALEIGMPASFQSHPANATVDACFSPNLQYNCRCSK